MVLFYKIEETSGTSPWLIVVNNNYNIYDFSNVFLLIERL